MAQDRKTILRGFDYRHCDDFAAYLADMARKGWHFKEWGAGLVFEKGEPEAATYAVEVFMNGSEYDTRPEPHTKEFAEYCEAAGWTLVDAKRKFCIFKRIREDAVPILTDEERLENIAKAERPGIWQTVFTSAAFTAMRFADFGIAFERYIFSNAQVMFTAVWTLLLILALMRCGQFYLWQYRCHKMLEQGEALYFGKGRQAFAQSWYSYLTGFIVLGQLIVLILLKQTALVISFLVIVAATVLMGFLIAKFRPDTASNQLIQVIVSALLFFGVLCFSMLLMFSETDEEKETPDVPLTYAHIGVEMQPEELYNWDEDESFFGNWLYYNLDYGTDYLYYYVYISEYDWVLDKIWATETDGKANETRTDCTDDWGAENAFRNGAGDYLVRYEDRILIFCGSVEEPLTQDQIQIIRENLDLR